MQLKLHTETIGRGADLFLVHGWSLHSGIWASVLPALAQNHRVTCVDLPGHGRSRELPMPASLVALGRLLEDVAPANAVWLGWSLGGLACMRVALDYPERVRALALVSTTPRFITAADWPHAMPLVRLQEMLTELRHDYHKTVQRFLALQVRGEAGARTNLRQLRKVLCELGEPIPASLNQGLVLLRDSDVRAELPLIDIPTMVITGGYDHLIPVQASEFLAASVPGAQTMIFPKAAHVPFLSNPKVFLCALKTFLENLPAVSPALASGHQQLSALSKHRT